MSRAVSGRGAVGAGARGHGARGGAVAWAGVAASLLLAAAPAARAADVPYLSGRVVDEAGILDADARQQLAEVLAGYERRTSNQIAVLTLRTLDGESIEDFAERTFRTWKLGQKGKDNGVLLVVVPDDRKMRIEVGYGLEGALPDVAASRVIRNVMAPEFRAGRYAEGLSKAVGAVIGQLDGVEGAIPDDAPVRGGHTSGLSSEAPDLPWPERILLGAFIFGLLGLFTALGVAAPGMSWFLYPFLIPFWATFPAVILGTRGALAVLCTYVVGFPLAKLAIKRTAWYGKVATSGGGRSRGGGSSWASSSSFGSSSSSSFSGGGGSSGGGGASGSW
jgi:uncharacterized protein